MQHEYWSIFTEPKCSLNDRKMYVQFSVPKLSLCYDRKASEDTQNFSLLIPRSRTKLRLNNDNNPVDVW